MQQVFKVLVYMGLQHQHAYIKAESMGQACRAAAHRMNRPLHDVEPLWAMSGHKEPDFVALKTE